MIEIKGKDIVVDGKVLQMKGYNLGNWLILERYMFGFPGTDQIFRRYFRYFAGDEKYYSFFDCYYRTYFTEADAEFMKKTGCNTLRIPFNYRIFESDDKPFEFSDYGFQYIDYVNDICRKYGIYTVIDYHASQGYENYSHCSDNSTGTIEFFHNRINQDRFVELWKFIADRYKDDTNIIGYDILNEPAPDEDEVGKLLDVYKRVIGEIRKIDKEHFLAIEGTDYAQNFSAFNELMDDKEVVSPHYYVLKDEYWNRTEQEKRDLVKRDLDYRSEYAEKINRPCWIGETGLSKGEHDDDRIIYLHYTLEELNRRGYSWSLWSYKDLFRMGMLSAKDDSVWMNEIRPFFDIKKKYLLDKSQQNKNRFNEVLFDEIEKDFPDLMRGNGVDNLKQMIWISYANGFASSLGKQFGKYMASKSMETLYSMIDSFRFENCELKENWMSWIKEDFGI